MTVIILSINSIRLPCLRQFTASRPCRIHVFNFGHSGFSCRHATVVASMFSILATAVSLLGMLGHEGCQEL